MDCSKTIDYLKEIERIYSIYGGNCKRCPLCDSCHSTAFFKSPKSPIKSLEQAIAIVQKWSDEHPRKTYLQDFFEKFPNAKKDSYGLPSTVCIKNIYGEKRNCCDDTNCVECWNQPMEE